jgi:ATP synthase subunit 6
MKLFIYYNFFCLTTFACSSDFSIFSPLDQFEIYPLSILIYIDHFYFIGIYNIYFTYAFLLAVTYHYTRSLLVGKNQTFLAIPTLSQRIFELYYLFIANIVVANIQSNHRGRYFPLIFVVFTVILLCNLVGLIPYNYTLTSQFIITLSFSVALFTAIISIGIRKNGLIKLFAIFFPGGIDTVMAPLLVPVEFLSFIFKPISLAARLFCNMLAGHTLLNVIAGFAWSLKSSSAFFFPLLILIPLFLLEFAVAFIQAYVFSLLLCVYINDVLNIH